MGTIKLKRGTGSPTNGDLAQYEVAMDVAAKQLYTSTNGTDVVTLSNEYTNADADARVNLQTGANLDLSSKDTGDLSEGSNLYYTAARDTAQFNTDLATKSTTDLSEGTNEYFTDARAVTAVEAANLTLAGTVDTDSALTAKGGFTVEATSSGFTGYLETMTGKRVEGGNAGTGPKTAARLIRDLETDVLSGGFDNRGVSLDFELISDDDGLTQYLGGIAMLPNNDDNTNPESWFNVFSYDGSDTLTISSSNHNQSYLYASLESQKQANLRNRDQYSGDGDNQAPLVVKADYENNDVVAAEFWNLTNDDTDIIKIQYGTDDAGTKTYNNEFRSRKDGDKKYVVFNSLSDNAADSYTHWAAHRNTTTGELKHNFYGQGRFDVDGEDHGAGMFLSIDMENQSTRDYVDGVNTTANWKSNSIPNGSEIFQRFTFADTAGGSRGAGYFGCRYDTANNGELTTMKLAAQTHDYTGEEEISINQKEATATVPFRYQGYTTTARNALSVNNGSVIYNTTTNKLEVYAAGSWVPLH
jgi:hypothetical protein